MRVTDRKWGLAQWNLAWKAVEVMRQVFGDGPVVSVDDDSKVMPQLYYLLWKMKRVSMWEVGNLNTGNGWSVSLL